MALLPVDQALARILAAVTPCPTETVGIEHAAGRTLAAPVLALRTQPPEAVSAMDGYALRARDCAAPGTVLRVVGTAPAGHPFDGKVETGTAVRIFTGAVVPQGADTVVIQEDTETLGDSQVRFTVAARTDMNIRPQGLDFKEGQALLNTGTILTARHVALAAAGNHAALPVARRPLIALIATGDELRAPGSALGPGEIIASNGYALAARARQSGAEILDLGIVPDNREAIAEALHTALARGADMVVSIGGASVGEHDLVRDVFVEAGMVLDFWKIAMRPGKPLMFGSIANPAGGHTLLLGLPGNPVSSYVCAELFMVPAIAAFLDQRPANRLRRARLDGPLRENGPRDHYMRAQIIGIDADGVTRVSCAASPDSSLLVPLAEADCLAIQPANSPALAAGTLIDILPLE